MAFTLYLVPPRSRQVRGAFSPLEGCYARYWEPTMPALPQKRLKLVPEPLAVGAVADAPPVLQATTPTAEYTCGNCDAVLIPADEDKILALIIHCTACGWYNSTGV